MVEPSTLRIMLTLALSSHWPIWQLDIQNAFLNRDLQEQVYIHQPPGFITNQFPSHVCCLHKVLYGLEQAPRAWFTKLSNSLIELGFQFSGAESSLFFRHIDTEILILLIYVDDILITGSDTSPVNSFISHLSNTFALRDLGTLSYFLGVEALID